MAAESRPVYHPPSKCHGASRTSNVIKPRVIPSLRWWIASLLFASTVINYIDRQTLSVLAPYLKLEHHWTNTDYANIVIAFRVAYSLGMALCGGSWTALVPGVV